MARRMDWCDVLFLHSALQYSRWPAQIEFDEILTWVRLEQQMCVAPPPESLQRLAAAAAATGICR